MDQGDLLQLVNHMEWADAIVWAALLEQHAAHSDMQIRQCVHHTHQVQWAYLQLWRGEDLVLPDLESLDDLQAIYEWCRRYYVELADFLETLDPTALERQIDFPWAEELVKQWGHARPVTLLQSILQITSHSAYHRGQANRRLRELGAEPPLTDFVVWIWMGKPIPEWKGVDGIRVSL